MSCCFGFFLSFFHYRSAPLSVSELRKKQEQMPLFLPRHLPLPHKCVTTRKKYNPRRRKHSSSSQSLSLFLSLFLLLRFPKRLHPFADHPRSRHDLLRSAVEPEEPARVQEEHLFPSPVEVALAFVVAGFSSLLLLLEQAAISSKSALTALPV